MSTRVTDEEERDANDGIALNNNGDALPPCHALPALGLLQHSRRDAHHQAHPEACHLPHCQGKADQMQVWIANAAYSDLVLIVMVVCMVMRIRSSRNPMSFYPKRRLDSNIDRNLSVMCSFKN